MEFEIDKDTLDDLEIFSKRSGNDGIRALFNTTRTLGARDLLQKIMAEPISDIAVLNDRLDLIRYFRDNELKFEVSHSQVDLIEHYLRLNKRFLRNNPMDALYDYYSNKINITPAYYIITTGISNIIELIKIAGSLIDRSESEINIPKALRIDFAPAFLKDDFLRKISGLKRRLTCFEINKLDEYFRKTEVWKVRQLLTFIYQMDVYESVARVARIPGWSLPVFSEAFTKMRLTGLFHPDINTPIVNDLETSKDEHLIFLTGPNMAGKSSFLKSVGLSVYLAHIGFPVPASVMETPLFNGIITTINLSDNIGDGLSHYYSEIKRIRYTALKIIEKGSVFVIFDELFRGTNPKDAFDASLLIIQALSKIPNCVFLISTHHTELAEKIKVTTGVSFKYLESNFEDETPHFSYKLKDGVSHNRSGMYILKSEGVLDILDVAARNQD